MACYIESVSRVTVPMPTSPQQSQTFRCLLKWATRDWPQVKTAPAALFVPITNCGWGIHTAVV